MVAMIQTIILSRTEDTGVAHLCDHPNTPALCPHIGGRVMEKYHFELGLGDGKKKVKVDEEEVNTIFKVDSETGEKWDLNVDGDPCKTEHEVIELGREIIDGIASQIEHDWIIHDAAKKIEDVDELLTVLNAAARVDWIETTSTKEEIEKGNLLVDVF
jgi:hypothetical protein